MNRGGIRAAHFISQLILHAPNLVAVNAEANIMPAESLAIIHDALKQSKGTHVQHDSLFLPYQMLGAWNNLCTVSINFMSLKYL